eukprot:gnl/MRDRNA2_/MRDRNA2_87824_c0_seq1.p1 gnl/MRDRNA2_/MRDRNA2_87824_c0~~gnl/MRDRNA2_/MRDRNA2_87824_c0_seq1.p1  ORF type:complete len:319 (+),score=79.05 gnl/MRDRNA2_/MRDRNA2_87824_c0_seq1:173-1129(+)
MEALLKLQSAPDASNAAFQEQMDIIAKCISNKDQNMDAGARKKEFENRVTSLISRANKDTLDQKENQNPQLQDGERKHRLAAESLMELVKVTAQLSQLEQVAAQTRGCEAVSSDAKKWQELTTVALDWSRKSLCEQQRGAIDKVAHLVKDSADALPGAAVTAPPLQAPVQPCPPKPTTVVQDAKECAIPTGFEQGETLRTHLEALAEEDANRILIVRRINRLGFESPQLLQNHFAEFGEVRRVFVAHSRVKPSAKRPVPRVRPAGLGFVLMETAEDAQKVANSGPQMMINDVSIEVKLYQPGFAPTGMDGEDKETPSE